MTDHTESEALGRLLASRADWFRLDLVQSPWGGDNWDITLRIDGAYDRLAAEDMLEHYWRELIEGATRTYLDEQQRRWAEQLQRRREEAR
jgi:hypothetical protein